MSLNGTKNHILYVLNGLANTRQIHKICQIHVKQGKKDRSQQIFHKNNC
jgi:hypothetical protein